jgi:hypothetical protein
MPGSPQGNSGNAKPLFHIEAMLQYRYDWNIRTAPGVS